MATDEDLKEKAFEADIERYLLTEGGYEKGNQQNYDPERAIDMVALTDFIRDSQPKEWSRYEKIYGAKAADQLYRTLQGDITHYGLIYVLRNGIDDRGVKLSVCFFTPASGLNAELVERYRKNRLTCTRQFVYSKRVKNSIDMVLSLNGIPVVAIELKNQFTGQTVEDSKRQWREDRNPKEPLFHFNNRILAYFGIDLYEAAMATELKGEKTFFMPFNQGSNGAGQVGGAGNPARDDGNYVTAYVWENVLRRDKLLAILQRYVMVQEETKLSIVVDKHGREKRVETKSKRLIFPRYHQFDVVEKLVDDTATEGAGHNYLIQHSAGSGKSNSIAWLTYRLASLHREDNSHVFDGVFVVTDRRVLNRQLQDTILGFEHVDGQITIITDKDNSTKLRDAINNGDRIIITTLHRFPIIYKELESRAGKHYAIIVDEAHSSQSGKSAEKLKAALADTDEALREMAEIEGKTEEELDEERDALMEDLLAQGQHLNLSFYAFTATPKPKTLQTFGTLVEKGETPDKDRYAAWHNYSMLQAIEEGFILDVLKNYTTYTTSFEIVKSVADNPEYEETPATRALKLYYVDHADTIAKKTAIIVNKFRDVTLTRMNGQAKAMVVTASRAHALRYFFAIKEYCEQNGITDLRLMVAFSGKVSYGGKEYTETMLNSTPERHISEDALPLYFASDLYNMLIVADKYQTGFDEPMLHTMFVDKKFKNVKAVQTLSRLNRWQKDKKDTFVFDFVNDTDEIKHAFEPFYTGTVLIKPVDVNYVYTFRKDIEQFHLWTTQQEEQFYELLGEIKKLDKNSRLVRLSNAFKPVLDRIETLSEEDQFKVRAKIKNFVRFYAYMAQIERTFDRSLYKAYVFADYLYRIMPKQPHERVDLNKKVTLLMSKITPTEMQDILLEGKPNIKGEDPNNAKKPEDKKDWLNNIIDKVNLMYRGDFTEADRVMIEGIFDRIQTTATKKMQKQAANNDARQFVESIFPEIFSNAAQDLYTEQTDAYRKLFENADFYNALMNQMGNVIYERFRDEEAKMFTVENLKSKLLPLVKDELESIKSSARTADEAFEWMIKVIKTKSIEKYNGMEDLVLMPLFKLFCSKGEMSTADKRVYLKSLVTGYESYLKKLYYLIKGKEVTDKNGSVEYAALGNAVYALRLDRLKYSEDETDKKFARYLDVLTNLRNTESHAGLALKNQEVAAGIRVVVTMYLYVTYMYITELEMANM